MNISGVMKRVCAWKAEVDRQLKKIGDSGGEGLREVWLFPKLI